MPVLLETSPETFEPRPAVAIVGRGRAGKDTAAEFLAKDFKVRFSGGCSWAGLHYVAEKLGIPVEEAWTIRHERRVEWYNLMNEFRKDDPARVIKEVLKTSDLVCGVRDGFELESARKEGLLDLVVWVERAQAPFDPTLTFGPESCDVVVTNHLNVPDYLRKWARFARSLGFPDRW